MVDGSFVASSITSQPSFSHDFTTTLSRIASTVSRGTRLTPGFSVRTDAEGPRLPLLPIGPGSMTWRSRGCVFRTLTVSIEPAFEVAARAGHERALPALEKGDARPGQRSRNRASLSCGLSAAG